MKAPPAKTRKGVKDAATHSKDMHAAIGKVVRYADHLAHGKPRLAELRDAVHNRLQEATNVLIAMEKAIRS